MRVITYRVSTEDLLHIRFAISPLFDLTWSMQALREPAEQLAAGCALAARAVGVRGARPRYD